MPGIKVMTPSEHLVGSCAPTLVHAERDSRFIMDGGITPQAKHLCYIMTLPDPNGMFTSVSKEHYHAKCTLFISALIQIGSRLFEHLSLCRYGSALLLS